MQNDLYYCHQYYYYLYSCILQSKQMSVKKKNSFWRILCLSRIVCKIQLCLQPVYTPSSIRFTQQLWTNQEWPQCFQKVHSHTQYESWSRNKPMTSIIIVVQVGIKIGTQNEGYHDLLQNKSPTPTDHQRFKSVQSMLHHSHCLPLSLKHTLSSTFTTAYTIFHFH